MCAPKNTRVMILGQILLISLGIFLLWGVTKPVQSQDESTCVSCHTSVKELVKITREIAATAPLHKSAENKGEG